MIKYCDEKKFNGGQENLLAQTHRHRDRLTDMATLWQWQMRNMTKLKSRQILKLKLCRRKKTQTLKLWQNSTNQNSDKTQNIKLLQNSTTIFLYNKNLSCERKLKIFNCDKTQLHKLQQNSKTQIGEKLNNSNCKQTQQLKLWPNS